MQQQGAFAGESLAATKTSAANSMTMNINAPGYDAVTQLCPTLGASTANCRMLAYTVQISSENAEGLCAAHAEGSLPTILNEAFYANLLPNGAYKSNLTGALLADLSVSGCPAAGSGRRLLQSGQDLVIVVSKVLVAVGADKTIAIVDPTRLNYINFFNGSTQIVQQLLGGGAIIIDKMPSSGPGSINGNSSNWVIGKSSFPLLLLLLLL